LLLPDVTGWPMSGRANASGTSAGRVLATVAALCVLGLTAVTGAAATITKLNYHVHKGAPIVHISQSPTPTPSVSSSTHQTYQAVNILVMGTDTRTGQGKGYGSTADSSGNGHSDTTLLVHVAADRTWAEVVSIPRDTTYHLPKCAKSQHIIDRFNAAFAGGGAICTIQLVEQITKRNVDHYVVVHLNDFKQVVNDLGGVPVCASAKISDPLTGTGSSEEGTNLVLRKGWTNLNGTQALQLMRARAHLGDGSDLSRISRQQIVLSAIVRKIVSKGTLENPARALSVLNALTSAVTADPDLADPQKAADFGLTLQGIKPSNIEFVRMPTLPNSDGATVRMSSQAIAMWTALAQDRPWPALAKPHPKPTGVVAPPGKPLKTLPSHVQVQVLNGSGVPGAATTLGNALHAKGFAFIGAGNYKSSKVAHTFIEYDPNWNESARTLGASLGGVPMVKVPGLKGTLKVVLGSDQPSVVAVYVATPKPAATYIGPQGTGVTTANKTTCITP
jgi:LCP family protein required for cell wall assembly